MSIRLVAGSFLFLTFPLFAQQQDPDKPKATPEQEMKELASEKERLQREIQYAKDRVGNAKSLLRDKLTGHGQAFRSIDAGTSAPPAPPTPVAPKQMQARVATPDQAGDFPNDTIALVNRRPITRASLDALLGYLRTTPGGLSEQQQSERAMYELLRIEAVTAAFEEANGAAERAATAMASLHDGRPIEEIVKEYGTCQGADPKDGKVEVMHNSIHGPMLEMFAFATKPGTNSKPFRTANGVVIFHSKAVEKGATPELDKAIGHVVQVPYTAEEGALQKAQLAVNMGQVDIVVRDTETLQLLPQMFRPMAAGAPGMTPAPVHDEVAENDIGRLQQAIAELEATIQKLTSTGEAGDQEKAKALGAQRDALRASMQAAASQKATHDHAQTVQEMRQVQAEIAKLSSLTDDASKAKVKVLQDRYAQLKQSLKPQAPTDTTPHTPPAPEAPKK